MQALTFALPVLLFVVLLGFWFLAKTEGKRELAWWVMLLPTCAVYVCMGWLLFTGKGVYHIQLDGVQVNLDDERGKGRELLVGEIPDKADKLADPLFRVKGYPVDSVKLRADKGGVRVEAGPGYEPGLLVFSDDKLLAIKRKFKKGRAKRAAQGIKEKDEEYYGYPQIVALEDGDEIVVDAAAGGGERKVLNIGEGRGAVTPGTVDYRVVGSNGNYDAKIEGYGEEVLLLKTVGEQDGEKKLVIKRGKDFGAGVKVVLNGKNLDLLARDAYSLLYAPGRTRIELMRQDPLAGTYKYSSAGGVWKDISVSRALTEERPEELIKFNIPTFGITAGGGAEDGLTLKGLAAESYDFMLKDGALFFKADKNEKDPFTNQPLLDYTIKKGEAVQIGSVTSPWGGELRFKGIIEKTEMVDEKEVVIQRMAIEFLPNAARGNGEIVMPILSREVELPVTGTKLVLPVKQPWNVETYPISQMVRGVSKIRSSVVFGFPGTARGQLEKIQKQRACLLITEPGVRVMRDGKPKIALNLGSNASTANLAENGNNLEFRQLRAKEFETYPVDVQSTQGSAQAASVVKYGSITLRRKLSELSIQENKETGKKQLMIKLAKPLIRSVPRSVLEDDVDNKQDQGIVIADEPSIGINQGNQLSVLDNQVEFPWLTGWFSRAVGQVDLHSGELTVRDYYSKKSVNYGKSFTVGGADRLMLEVRSIGVPWKLLILLFISMLVTLFISLLRGYSMTWVSLYFVVAFISCSRLLFARAVWLNPPFGEDKLTDATFAMLVLPLAVFICSGLGYWLLKVKFFQTRLENMVERKNPYLWLIVTVIFLLALRIVLLGMGMKEGFNLGARIAFSVVYVPMFLLLFGIGCSTVLVRLKSITERSAERELLWFLRFVLIIFVAQGMIGVLVSDIGSFLYMIPQTLVVAAVGLTYFLQERKSNETKQWKKWVFIAVCVIPVLFTAISLKYPKIPVSMGAGDLLSSRGLKQVETNATKLRVVNFADPQVLENMGTDAAELILQDHQLMENYARRGWDGEGFLNVNVVRAKYETALNDNVSAVYIFGQFGIFGGCAIVICYVFIMLSSMRSGWNPMALTAVLSAMVIAFTSIYMIGANWGFMPFTGRNLYGLGLNSRSDLLEFLLLLMLIGIGHWAQPIKLPFQSKSKVKRTKDSNDDSVIDV